MPDHPSQRKPNRSIQFSLTQLLIVFTAAAIVLGFWDTIPATFHFFSRIIIYTFPAVLLAAAVYGRGDYRAFAIGALVPFVHWLANWPFYDTSPSYRIAELFQLIMAAIVCGTATLLTRRWIQVNAPK
jgi:hypothetical protein